MEPNLDFGPGRMDIRFDDAREEAEVILVGLANPFMGPVVDCLDKRGLEACADGGPIEGRYTRGPVAEAFCTVEETLGGVELPDDVVEPRCLIGDFVGD